MLAFIPEWINRQHHGAWGGRIRHESSWHNKHPGRGDNDRRRLHLQLPVLPARRSLRQLENRQGHDSAFPMQLPESPD